jgi:hypothetical protein
MPNISGFFQVERAPGQGTLGGTNSAFLPGFSPPAGSSSSWNPFPPLTVPSLEGSTFNFSSTFTLPNNGVLPTIPPFTSSTGGTATAAALTVGGFTGIDTITVSGSLTATSTGAASVDIYGAPGGGSGDTTLVYGKITASSVITAGIPKWSYTVTPYLAGVAGSSVTAFNLLEKENTLTLAYGYTLTSGTFRIPSTSYYVQPVPNSPNTWVRMELTNNVDGVSKYWFSAPNIISGTC